MQREERKEIGTQGLQKNDLEGTPKTEIDNFFRSLNEEDSRNTRLKQDILKNDAQPILWGNAVLPNQSAGAK